MRSLRRKPHVTDTVLRLSVLIMLLQVPGRQREACQREEEEGEMQPIYNAVFVL